MSRSQILPITLLALLSIIAFDVLILQLERNGYSTFLADILDDPLPRFLPGSDRLLVRKFVNVPVVDRFLATWSLVWANVSDGSRPEFSLLSFYFGGQLVSFLSVVMIESSRTVGLSGLVFNPIIWGLLMQFLSFGLVAPLFFITHLLWTSKSNLSQITRLRDPTPLHATTLAFSLGYIIPSIFLAYPFSQHSIRQWCDVLWAPFPLYVVLLQMFYTDIIKRTSVGQNTWTSKVQLDRKALSHAYGFAWNMAVAGQMCTYSVLIAANIFPGWFPVGAARSLTLEKVFIPGVPHTNEQFTDAAAVMHSFFNYDLYIGSLAALIWAVHLLSRAKPGAFSSREERTNLLRGVITSVLLSGPGGAVIALMQHRDETVLTAEAKTNKSQ